MQAATTKLITVHQHVSKAVTNVKTLDKEFTLIITDEMEHCHTIKEGIQTKTNGLDEKIKNG